MNIAGALGSSLEASIHGQDQREKQNFRVGKSYSVIRMEKIVTATEDVDAVPNVAHAKTNPKPWESG
jgi:hypothetical protein